MVRPSDHTPVRAHLVQGVPQGDLAGDEPEGQAVVLLLQTEAGLLQTMVLLLRKATICQGVSCGIFRLRPSGSNRI